MQVRILCFKEVNGGSGEGNEFFKIGDRSFEK